MQVASSQAAPILKAGEEWNYVIAMLAYRGKLTKEQYFAAYKKRQSIKNEQHIMQILYELGYINYHDFAEFIIEIFGDSLTLIRGHSSQLHVKKDDVKPRYFYGETEVSPCFTPVLNEYRTQFVLNYDDFSIMNERVTHSASSSSDKERPIFDFNFEQMVRDAANQGASDVHIIPKENFYYVFFRKNGDLVEQEKYLLDIEIGFEFVRQIKIEASPSSRGNFKADNHIAPQDARLLYGDIDLRLVFIPDGINGQRMSVIARVIKKTIIRDPDLKAKGFHDPIIAAINRTSRLEGGFIILSGITGSGKSTLLADILATIDKRRRVLTIEDPIEYVLSGKNITQHQLYIPSDESDKDRMGYLEFTKAAKRADPNVLSIGEMRKNPDLIDAVSEMVYAGQLVYTTIHIQSCFKVVHAMEHVFKMNRESVVPSIFLSINMKLTKKLCDHCKTEDTEKTNLSRLNELKSKLRYESKESLDEFLNSKDRYTTYLHNPDGCPKCGYTGYAGRVPMYEYFEPTVELIDFILKTNPTNYDIEKYVCSRNIGQNRLDTYVQRLIDGEVDTSQAILDAIL